MEVFADEVEALRRQMDELPGIKISDGDVWLIFPNVTISIEAICEGGARGPIVKKNLRAWRDKALEAGEQRDCDNCSITGLLCPIRNNDPPFTFPCPHWKALEVGDK